MSILIRTPNKSIPMCEVIRENGETFLRFKKPQSSTYDQLRLEEFLKIVFNPGEN